MNEIKSFRFKASMFFKDEFPLFFIRKFRHMRGEFDETYRMQRDFWKIIYVIEGHGRKLINERSYKFGPGSVYLIHPDDQTTFVIESEYIDIYNILFMPELIQDELQHLANDFDFFSIFHRNFQDEVDKTRREQLYILDAWKEISRLIKSLADEYEEKKPNYQSIIKLRLLELLILISRQGIEKIKKNDRHNIVNYIDHIIDNYYHEQFGLDFIAKKIELNKSYLCRVYKSLKGKSIFEALKQRRLQESRTLLSNSAMNISEICYACGFNDLSYFYRAFRADMGLNPGDYRKKFGQY